jgi:cytochrome c biogenesis protein CcdA
VNPVLISLAFLAGSVATVNPCGFALLPAFISLYIGDLDGAPHSASTRVLRGVGVGAVVTAGFMLVFGAIGLPIAFGATALTKAFPWAAILVGVALVGLGVYQLSGRQLSFAFDSRISPGEGRHVRSMLLFGAGYAVASLGCTLPAFLAVAGGTLTSNGPLAALLAFVAYAMGMGTVLMAVSMGLALLQSAALVRMRRLSAHVGRASGILLILVGAYVLYYWLTLLSSPTAAFDNPVIATVTRISGTLQGALGSGGGRLLVAAVTVLMIALAAWAWLRHWGAAEQPDEAASPQREQAAAPRSR